MAQRVDNYQLQVRQAKKRFLTYDQQELISRCKLHWDAAYIYTRVLGEDYRICRSTGDMQRLHGGAWIDGNGFGEVMTVLDWLCDSRTDRYITGKWINPVTHGPCFHTNLQEDGEDTNAQLFSREPEAFSRACQALGGEKYAGADISYAIELIDGLQILVQLWHGDEEFPPRLRCLWDENYSRYLRYETTWYAVGLLMRRLREQMSDPDVGGGA